MTGNQVTKTFYMELLHFLHQMKHNPKMFFRIPTIENIITYLRGYSDGVIGVLIKECEEDVYVLYNSPDTLVRQHLIETCEIPETKSSSTVDYNYTMIMYFKNKYPENDKRVDAFLDLCIKCYQYELSR